MKLRTKLTLFSIALIVIAIVLCCAIILTFVQQREMQDIIALGLEDIGIQCDDFVWGISENTPNPPLIRRSFLKNKFLSLSKSDEFTLRIDGEFLINNVGYDIENLILKDTSFKTSADGKTQYKIVHVKNADYFIAHTTVNFESGIFDISLIRNITDTTNSIRVLATKCIISGASVTFIAAIVMWLIIYQSMKPVQKLKAGAAELAQGHYQNRITPTGKDELAELAFDFNCMADAIEANINELHEKSERQQSFINDLSHELKTPITSILLCSETLLNRKVPPETLHRSLERIYDQGKWLETLSQKLMMLVMLQGEIAMQPESVPALLDAVREATMDTLHEQGMELITDCSMDVLPMDFDLLRSALTNLVVNARKASSEGQTITIHAHDRTIAV